MENITPSAAQLLFWHFLLHACPLVPGLGHQRSRGHQKKNFAVSDSDFSLKECLDWMIPTVIRIIYILSTDANVVSCLSPLLKKPSLDLNNLRNYRPTSYSLFCPKYWKRLCCPNSWIICPASLLDPIVRIVLSKCSCYQHPFALQDQSHPSFRDIKAHVRVGAVPGGYCNLYSSSP